MAELAVVEENPLEPLNLIVLIKHKEIAALWELLKLATAQGQSSMQTRTTLANVLLSKIHLIVFTHLHARDRLLINPRPMM